MLNAQKLKYTLGALKTRKHFIEERDDIFLIIWCVRLRYIMRSEEKICLSARDNRIKIEVNYFEIS